MSTQSAVARAHPNIAFIKYWGNRDDLLRLPANGSISMNLKGLETVTRVTFDSALTEDELTIGSQPTTGAARQRVIAHLDRIRQRAGIASRAQVASESNFPIGAGLASSASAFAALTLAGTAAAGLRLSERELSLLARMGSGSACRSIPAGFVEWHAGADSDSSYPESIAPPEHWDLVDVIAIVSRSHKAVGSTQGHRTASTSPLQAARVQSTPARLDRCRQALQARNFAELAQVVELDSNMLHAVIMTSSPPLLYWEPTSLTIMNAVRTWRGDGLPVCFSLDAGPNVHCLCPSAHAETVAARLRELPGVHGVLRADGGPGAQLIG